MEIPCIGDAVVCIMMFVLKRPHIDHMQSNRLKHDMQAEVCELEEAIAVSPFSDVSILAIAETVVSGIV